MTGTRLRLDEGVGRVFERLLRERGHDVEQAKDRVGEHTSGADPLERCGGSGAVLLTNNPKQFEPLHEQFDHAGILLCYEQHLPDADPEGLARTVDGGFSQSGTSEIENRLIDPGGWYDWLQG